MDTKSFQRLYYSNGISLCMRILVIVSWLIVVCTLPLSLCFCVRITQEYERAAVFRLGRLKKTKGPGMIFILPCIESYKVLDLRSQVLDVPPQEVITKDSVTVSVDAVVYYHISNPMATIINVQNPRQATGRLAQTTLTNMFGAKDLQEVLSQKEGISHEMQAILYEATKPWGIEVERVEVEDISLPKTLQRAMAAEAEATREARAKIIMAEGEIKASYFLNDASKTINESPYALQLKYLQTLSTIANEKQSTIVFPVPLEINCSFQR